jgi:hypothetical protein
LARSSGRVFSPERRGAQGQRAHPKRGTGLGRSGARWRRRQRGGSGVVVRVLSIAAARGGGHRSSLFLHFRSLN